MSVVLLLSRPRSGTGALASVLERHPDIIYKTEVLDTTSEHSFFSWLTNQGMMARTPYEFAEYFKSFIAILRADRYINIIDIKTNSLGAFCHEFHHFLDIPWILSYLSTLAIPILYLRRSNLLDCFVSAKLADLNNAWHVADMNDVKTMRKTISVNLQELLRYMRLAKKEILLLGAFFEGYKFSATIDYDDCFIRDNNVSVESLAKISELLNLDLTNLNPKPRFVKQTPWSLTNKVENYEEVVKFLSSATELW